MTITIERTPRVRHSRRFAGLVVAGALAFVGLSTVPAQAAEPAAPALKWKVSQALADHLSTHTFSGGASEDGDKVVTFPQGTGYLDTANGKASISYEGSATFAFVNAGNTLYSVTLAEPAISVDAEGEGVITALVSSQASATSTTPTRVTVTTFNADAGDWAVDGISRSLTATPDWAGVIAPDSADATEAGIPAGFPLSGKAFAKGFLTQIVPTVKSWFYVNGTDENSVTNLKKSPAEFTATVDGPKTLTTTTAASPTAGLTVNVAGTGFTGKSTSPGDDGVYVGIALAGGLPDVSSPGGMSSFAGAQWVPASGIAADGSFATTFTAPSAALDSSKSYALYTWRAHAHSTTSQDTETPLTIDFGALTWKNSVTTATLSKTSAAYGTSNASVTAKVTNATSGKVSFFNNNAALGTVDVNTAGQASIVLPAKLAVGTHTVTAKFLGNDSVRPSASTVATLKVTKSKSTATLKVTKKPTSKKKGKATVTVKSTSKGIVPAGKVTITIKKKGQKTKTIVKTLTKKGTKNVALPKLKKGTWKVKVTYKGNKNQSADSSKTYSVKIKK